MSNLANTSFNEAIARAFAFCGVPEGLDGSDHEAKQLIYGMVAELINHFGYFAGWEGNVTKVENVGGDPNTFVVVYTLSAVIDGVLVSGEFEAHVWFHDGEIYLPIGY